MEKSNHFAEVFTCRLSLSFTAIRVEVRAIRPVGLLTIQALSTNLVIFSKNNLALPKL